MEIFIAGTPLTVEKKENLYERAERFGISRDQLVITENTGGTPQGANEEIIKGFYTIANDEVRKRENLISELEAELKKLEDAQIPYVQIKFMIVMLPNRQNRKQRQKLSQ